MKLVQLGRSGGKTELMIHWLKSHKRHALVVFNEREKQRILNQYFPDDKEEMQTRIITSLIDLRGRSQQTVGFDNLDIFLQILLGPHELGPVTITNADL